MSARDRILDAAEELIMEGRLPPPLDAVAARAGVSKGGVLYHFTAESLLQALVVRAIAEADRALVAAAESGTMAITWLTLSRPAGAQSRLYRGLLSMLQVTARGDFELPPEVTETTSRWDAMLLAELGDPARALVVRLVGDGLLFAALTGIPMPHVDLDAVIADLGLGARR